MERLFLCFGFLISVICQEESIIQGTVINVNNFEVELPGNQHEKAKTFYDYQTHVIAYKDLVESKCYIERMQLDRNPKTKNEERVANPKTLHMFDVKLSKRQAYSLAGSRVVEFCRGFPMYLLQELHPDLNKLQYEEEWANELTDDEHSRRRRDSQNYYPGRVHGQTQSQYLQFGNDQNSGKAEAEATLGSSKAVVTGNSGMGQAQSQSMPYGCEGCYDQEQVLGLGGKPGPGRIERPTEGGYPGKPTVTTGTQGVDGDRGVGYPAGGPVDGRYPPGKPDSARFPAGRPESGAYVPRRPGEAPYVPGRPGEGAYVPGRPGEGAYVPRRPGEGAYVPGRPGEGAHVPGEPGEGAYVPRRPGEGAYVPGRPGEGAHVPGRPGEGAYVPGRPGEGAYVPGRPGESAYVPGRPGEGAYVPGRPGEGAYVPGRPGEGAYVPGRPGEGAYVPGRPGEGAYVPGRPGEGTYVPGRPGEGKYVPGGTAEGGYPGASLGEGAYTPGRPGEGTHVPGRPGADRYPTVKPGESPGRPDEGRYPSGKPGEGPYLPGGPGEDRYYVGRPGDDRYVPGKPGELYPPEKPGVGIYPSAKPEGGYPPQYPDADGYPSRRPDGDAGGGRYPAAVPGYLPGRPGGDGYPSARPTGEAGRFGGHFAGDYQHTTGQQGKFSGVFSGQYDTSGRSGGGGGGTVTGYQPDGYHTSSPGAGGGISTFTNLTQRPSGYLPPSGTGYETGTGRYGNQSQGGRFSGTFAGQYDVGQGTGFGGAGSEGGLTPGAATGPPYGRPETGIRPDIGGADVGGKPLYEGKDRPGYGGVGGGRGYEAPGTGISSGVGRPGYETPGGIGHGITDAGRDTGYRYPEGGGRPGYGYTGAGVGPDYGRPTEGTRPGYAGTAGAGGLDYGGIPAGPERPDYGRPGEVGRPDYDRGYGAPDGIYKPGYGKPGVSGYDDIGRGGPGYAGAVEGGSRYGTPGYEDGRVQTGAGGRPEDDGYSQVQTSVQQVHNETQASSSAQGKYAGGNAQSQVSGTYSGSGSFSASAGTNDGKRGAQTQVSGGKEGATSSAQGLGGRAQSQAQVQYSSETSDTAANAQTNGWNQGTNTQVQGGIKSGMADAQANGPGSTSSQAQIGFVPPDEDGVEDEEQDSIFRGGGTANAQSSTYTGQSQVQLQGKFLQGIKYTGSAQAGSGKTAGGGNQSQFETVSYNFPTFKPLTFETPQPQKISASSSTANKTVTVQSRKIRKPLQLSPNPRPPSIPNKLTTTTSPPLNDEEYDEDEYDYDMEDDATTADTEKHIITQSTRSQKQHILLDPLEDIDAVVTQAQGDPDLPQGTILQPGQRIPGTTGYQIPQGFRGVVKAVSSGPYTTATGHNSQAQSVSLTRGKGEIIYKAPVYAVSSNTGTRNGKYSFGSGYTYQPVQYQLRAGGGYPNFVSATRSETGLQNLKTGKKIPSVYYSQSSTCGYFTNTCIYNGNTKICIPKPKVNPDGSPVVC